jgi:hypothetical protein
MARYMAVGEATPMYLCDPDAPGRIHQTLPEARFIVLLRDPVARTWSHYRMARAKGHVTDDLDTLIAAVTRQSSGAAYTPAQLDRWRALFPGDRFLILFFEEVMAAASPRPRPGRHWLGVEAAPLLATDPEARRNAATGIEAPRSTTPRWFLPARSGRFHRPERHRAADEGRGPL